MGWIARIQPIDFEHVEPPEISPISAAPPSVDAVDISVNAGACGIVAVPKMGLDGLDKAIPTMPILGTIVIDDVEFTAISPAITEVNISAEDPPAWNVPDPGFEIPPAPVVAWPIFNVSNPILRDIPIASAPFIELPPAPTILGISIPSPPDYMVPEFDAELPIDDLTPPTISFNWEEVPYGSGLKNALDDWLLRNITLGGTGLDEETEQAIYDRAISRQAEEEEAKYNEVLNFFASRGFTLPPGALNGQLLEIRNMILKAREDLNNDILVKQADLAQKNTHFTIENSKEWENILIGAYDKLQQRSFEAAKASVEAALSIYRTRIEAYSARLKAYEAQATVYVARIQGEAAKAEFYKAQIEGVKASVEVQKAFVDAYEAQVQGVRALVELYRAELESSKIIADINATEVESYKALIQAYVARVQASTARYEGYKAQISGEVAKAEMYKARADAYESEVSAYKARADIDLTRVQAAVEYSKAEVNLYLAEVEKYKSEVDKAVRTAEAEVTVLGLEVDVAKVKGTIYSSELDVTSRMYAGAVQEQKNYADVCVQRWAVMMREMTANAQIQSAVIRANAAAQAQVAAASIGVYSISQHSGWQATSSASMSHGQSLSNVLRESDDDVYYVQHIYPHYTR